MALSLVTILGLTALLVFPTQFYIYAGIFCSWGLSILLDGGGATPPFALDVSGQERDILSRIQKGEKYERIARELGVSVSTVKRRVKKLFRALRTPNLACFLKRYKDEPVDAIFSAGAANKQNQADGFQMARPDIPNRRHDQGALGRPRRL
ncbi:MAG: LuxR C-terminal-related transcriptional regulator [Treponema sp.]|jgi:hypothetical protein|nr:LuxR C-terminal-related transcriptional regulator [Treponema sp.]